MKKSERHTCTRGEIQYMHAYIYVLNILMYICINEKFLLNLRLRRSPSSRSRRISLSSLHSRVISRYRRMLVFRRCEKACTENTPQYRRGKIRYFVFRNDKNGRRRECLGDSLIAENADATVALRENATSILGPGHQG